MKLIYQIPQVVKKFKRKKLNTNWHTLSFILSNTDKFTEEFKNQHGDVQEIEHQVGRYLNMKAIIEEIKEANISGDLVEFGTWQGLGLILLKKMFTTRKMKYIGIDSFEGLPEDSSFWRKGMFNNTSLDLVLDNIKAYGNDLKDQVTLIKGWFSDKRVKDELIKTTNDIILVHFDADLGSSTIEALSIIEPYLTDRKKPIYFLFDDWGCHPDEVPDAFLNWVKQKQAILKFDLIKISSTRFTRYYKLVFSL